MKRKDTLPRFYNGDIYSKIIIFICIIFALFMRYFVFAAFMAAAFLCSFFFSEFTYRLGVRKMRTYLEQASLRVGASESMPGFPFPAVSITEKGKITWYNSAMDKMMDGELLFQKDIRDYVPTFDVSAMNEAGLYPVYSAEIQGEFYHVHAHKTPPQEDGSELILIYFLNCTAFEKLNRAYKSNRFVAMMIAFDNFEEVINGMGDEARNILQTSVDRSLSAMASEVGGIFRKTERDRYFVVLSAGGLQTLIQKKFPILDTVREIQCGNTIAPTLSIGIGFEGDTFLENDAYARAALDMALGRGGDQVVVKNGDTLEYFGGKTREVEKRTKVKARVVANALRELILQSDSVVILGHKNADIDCVGAAMGVVSIARHLGKKAYILKQEFDDTATSVLKTAIEEPLYKDVFINRATAGEIIGERTLIIVVDTHSLSYADAPELIENAKQVVLIDHHRRSSNFIQNYVLSYLEPYASSTCEMVTEMLPYLTEKNILMRLEAEALYAGIYLDTKSFMFKTGVRTLEAAAYLRRAGIDPIAVKQFFKSNLETFTAKASLIQAAKVVNEHIAISLTEEIRTPSVVAQAADELLDIAAIDTSFVIARSERGCIVSGRSTGDINVQVILEKLGGGGHFAVAGAQIEGADPYAVEEQLLAVIEAYLEDE